MSLKKLSLITILFFISLISFIFCLHFVSHAYVYLENIALERYTLERDKLKQAYLTYTGQKSIEVYTRLDLIKLANHKALQHRIDPKLIESLIEEESAWDPEAISSAGAMGLTQVMPEWRGSEICRAYASHSDIFQPSKNLDCGLAILSHEIKKHGSVKLALQAYNGGSKCTNSVKNPTCFRSTEQYANRIINRVSQKMFY